MYLVISNYGITITSDTSWKAEVSNRHWSEFEKTSLPADTVEMLFIKIPQMEKLAAEKFLSFRDTELKESSKTTWEISRFVEGKNGTFLNWLHVTSLLRFSRWCNQSYSICWYAPVTFSEAGLGGTSSSWCDWDFVSWETKHGAD